MSELAAAYEGGSRDELEDEFGDLLFTMAQWARHLSIEPETALRRATRKFTARVEAIEDLLAAQGMTWSEETDVDALWDQAKGLSRMAILLKPFA